MLLSGLKSVAKDGVRYLVSEVTSAKKDMKEMKKDMKEMIKSHVIIPDDPIDSDSDNSSDEEEGDPLKEKLEQVAPFLKLAEMAYKDESIAGNSDVPYVIKSRLVKKVQSPNALVNFNVKDLQLRVTTDTQVHVCLLDEGSLAFVFRGTEASIFHMCSFLRDLATDMMKFQVPVTHYDGSCETVYDGSESDIKAHRGFLLAFHDVTNTRSPEENIKLVADRLGAPAENVRRVICVGHSLGGALATLCAHWCRHVAYPNADIWCITIGSPRVGNRRFAKDFKRSVTKGRSYRLVNKADIVTRVPLISVLCGYKHVCGRIHMLSDRNRKGDIHISGRRMLLKYASIKNHFMDSYTKTVSRALQIQHHHMRLPPIPSPRLFGTPRNLQIGSVEEKD
ncbi:hypothetical protein KP509_04G051400 [Ceratopteris richardii]|uniref:Fungal lipase-type domain-containing protein n=1 Tax=Ceratopteris richardii TaxID=49495 RepID=A0A8T2UVD3_CERRI|nr:hypothetical protein KP509_04G051100 [Ceratopteris richardii]KAH7439232.1 hypothetical protein KP509_04G051400 [Ceratopteris richardii]